MDSENNEMRKEAESFIRHHLVEETDLRKMSLLKLSWGEPLRSQVLNTISAYRKLKSKVPTWYKQSGLWFNSRHSIEQASSELTAKFKRTLLQGTHYNHGVDLSGGLGVDSYFLAPIFKRWTYVEPKAELLDQFKHNTHQLGAKNIVFEQCEAESFLDDMNPKADFFYVDPDRRPNTLARRAVGFNESIPDMNFISSYAKKYGIQLLVKSSPMIDLEEGLKVIPAQKIYVVSVRNEVKEVLWHYSPNEKDVEVEVEVVELDYEWDTFKRPYSARNEGNVPIGDFSSDQYIMLPSAAIMKAALHDTMANANCWTKAANNTHLYFANSGSKRVAVRIFKPLRELPTSPKKFKKEGINQANIICRNSLLTTAQIVKKYRVQEGGEEYLICFRDYSNTQRFILAQRV